MTEDERDHYHVCTLLHIEYLAQQAERHTEELIRKAEESIRRSRGQHFRHLRKWVKQGD